LHTAKLADMALAAAQSQHVVLPGQDTAAVLAADAATALIQLRRRIKDLDKAIGEAFANHPQAEVIRSLPGMGSLVAAEFVVAVGDLSTFATPDQLAAYAGLVPVPNDSGRRTGNLRRPSATTAACGTRSTWPP
jgi:transposase